VMVVHVIMVLLDTLLAKKLDPKRPMSMSSQYVAATEPAIAAALPCSRRQLPWCLTDRIS